MATPKKPGIDYFPVDVNLLGSTKMRVVQSRYGAEGCLLYFYIVSAIMRERCRCVVIDGESRRRPC